MSKFTMHPGHEAKNRYFALLGYARAKFMQYPQCGFWGDDANKWKLGRIRKEVKSCKGYVMFGTGEYVLVRADGNRDFTVMGLQSDHALLNREDFDYVPLNQPDETVEVIDHG